MDFKKWTNIKWLQKQQKCLQIVLKFAFFLIHPLHEKYDAYDFATMTLCNSAKLNFSDDTIHTNLGFCCEKYKRIELSNVTVVKSLACSGLKFRIDWNTIADIYAVFRQSIECFPLRVGNNRLIHSVWCHDPTEEINLPSFGHIISVVEINLARGNGNRETPIGIILCEIEKLDTKWKYTKTNKYLTNLSRTAFNLL